MKKLEHKIRKNGFNYHLIIRDENKALYDQRDDRDVLHGHEIFKIQKVKEKEVFGKLVEAHEKFPSDRDFGITAWSVGIDRNVAICKYEKL